MSTFSNENILHGSTFLETMTVHDYFWTTPRPLSRVVGSARRLDGEKLPISHGDETRGEISVVFDESDERSHLLWVRSGVIDNQQPASPKYALQVGPPA